MWASSSPAARMLRSDFDRSGALALAQALDAKDFLAALSLEPLAVMLS